MVILTTYMNVYFVYLFLMSLNYGWGGSVICNKERILLSMLKKTSLARGALELSVSDISFGDVFRDDII